MDVVVIGIGRVGLIVACCLAKSGHRVTAVENNRNKLKRLESGVIPLYEPGIGALLREGIGTGRLAFAHAIPRPLKTDIVMGTVNTPPLDDGPRAEHAPQIGIRTCGSIGQQQREG